MVTVGDEHVGRLDPAADGGDARGVRDPLDAMLDVVGGDRAEEITTRGKEIGEARGKGKSPDG